LKIITVNPDIPEAELIKEAADVLKNGGLVAFPTETVYGLGAIHNNKSAIERLFKVKKRPKNKPFSLLISDIDMIKSFGCEVSPVIQYLMEKFWPGPLTLILSVADSNKTVAFRMPDNAVARALIEQSRLPLAAPSANISGNRSPKTAQEVIEDLDGVIDTVLDGGPVALGIDSTIIDATSFPYRVVREGAIPRTSLQDAWSDVKEGL